MKFRTSFTVPVVALTLAGCGAPPQIVPVVPPGAEVREIPPPDLTSEPSTAVGESISAAKKENLAKIEAIDPAAPPPITADEAKTQGLVIESDGGGKGEGAQVGKSVSVHYTGKLKDGTVFDSSIQRGVPFTFFLGRGQVIKGWDAGLVGMKVGEKRKLTIPPGLAYGDGGSGKIPPKSTLIFDVEMIAVD